VSVIGGLSVEDYIQLLEFILKNTKSAFLLIDTALHEFEGRGLAEDRSASILQPAVKSLTMVFAQDIRPQMTRL
jgi:hypothetical protein